MRIRRPMICNFTIFIIILTIVLMISNYNLIKAIVLPEHMEFSTDDFKRRNYSGNEIIFESKPISVTTVPKLQKRYKILYWTKVFDSDDFYFGLGHKFADVGCKINACETTNDKNEYNTSDAVMMHIRDLGSPHNLPSYRLAHHKWIFFLLESPHNTRVSIGDFNGLFNLTMTYRLDSDIPAPYGRFYQRKNKNNVRYNHALGKKKLVAWFVSNCDDVDTGRIRYAKELQKYIPVDIYGKCGPLKCDITDNTICDKMLNDDYKFYLSFENSLCTDYITEKVWKILKMNIVPVVMGGADYKKQLPLHSFIDVRDFKTPKELADYLILLDKKDSLYNEYFDWKMIYAVSEDHMKDSFCDLCEYLHTNEGRISIYNRVDLWWNKDNDCKSPTYLNSLSPLKGNYYEIICYVSLCICVCVCLYVVDKKKRKD